MQQAYWSIDPEGQAASLYALLKSDPSVFVCSRARKTYGFKVTWTWDSGLTVVVRYVSIGASLSYN